MPIPDCLTDEQLTCLIAGDLDPIASVDWIEHVDECDDCQQRLDSLSRTSPPISSDDSLPGELSRLSFSNTSASPSIADELLNAIEVKMQRDSSTVPNDSGAFMTKAIHSRGAPDRIGPYAIVKRLAIGGMSTVYEGRHVNLGRSVAIKLLGHGSRFSRTSAKQVLSEWRAHGRLSHPGIVVATDAGVVGGAPYLVTELIDGFDLAATVKTIGPLGASDAAALIGEMASALGYAHREGVAHLDIKPSNVMLDQDGNVKVLDLGTAQVSQLFPDEVAAQAGNASSSSLFGTLAFMAPERTRTEAFSSNQSSFDALVKADLYSLGCTWHFLLTGQAPFGNVASGDTPGHSQNELIQSHCNQAPASIVFDAADPASDDVRERTEILYQRLLAKRPADRPDDMQSVAEECQDIAGGAKLPLVAGRRYCEGLAGLGPPPVRMHRSVRGRCQSVSGSRLLSPLSLRLLRYLPPSTGW